MSELNKAMAHHQLPAVRLFCLPTVQAKGLKLRRDARTTAARAIMSYQLIHHGGERIRWQPRSRIPTREAQPKRLVVIRRQRRATVWASILIRAIGLRVPRRTVANLIRRDLAPAQGTVRRRLQPFQQARFVEGVVAWRLARCRRDVLQANGALVAWLHFFLLFVSRCA